MWYKAAGQPQVLLHKKEFALKKLLLTAALAIAASQSVNAQDIDHYILPLYGEAPRYATYEQFLVNGGYDEQLAFMLPEVLDPNNEEVPSLLRLSVQPTPRFEVLVGIYDDKFRRTLLIKPK